MFGAQSWSANKYTGSLLSRPSQVVRPLMHVSLPPPHLDRSMNHLHSLKVTAWRRAEFHLSSQRRNCDYENNDCSDGSTCFTSHSSYYFDALNIRTITLAPAYTAIQW